MAEIKNTFLKGKMNQDLDSRILPNGEYREARNLSISRSESSTVGEFENVLGNTAISSLSDLIPPAITDTEIIGQLIDENSNYAYFFATDFESIDPTVRATNANNCYIVRVNLDVTQITAPVVLVTGFFLNFNKSFRITGVNLVENLLFWTDNLNQPRKINVDLANPSDPPVEIPTHYTNEDQISVAKYAPYEPILVMERIQTSLTVAVNNSATIVVASSADIKVGDIITNKNKITGQTITELITVIGKPDIDSAASPAVVANTLTLSKAITIANGAYVDFSRPSMNNKRDFEMANHSSDTVTIAGGGTPNPITATYTIGPELTSNELIFLYGGKNGVPRIGDLVSGSGISSDTRISSVSAVNQFRAPNASDPDVFVMYQTVTFTLNKTTTLSDGDSISVSNNPNYDAAWQGDEKFLEDKFVRFSYRFKFEDNEYSLMAPFSQVMFIPKQYSEFGGGSFSSTTDMDDAYKSTILTWFENNINNILLKIPMTGANAPAVIADLKIINIDILYKESDALAVKVLETIDLSLIDPAISPFSSIEFDDAIHGNNTKYFLDYDYSSTKPYKTLPNNQITRVSDKVPIRALAQEVIGNRVVYGNYLDRHTGPNSIDFSAFAVNKSTNFDNYTQFPKHQLKQDRTYQVGFVLSDRYGRQSDVILSSYDGLQNIRAGSTVFNPYNGLVRQTTNPILDWLGNSLNVTLYNAINPTYSEATGSPGLYSATNPLGWYSYKVVVKQTEQEYYNVYLPGFVNGYPIQGTAGAERDTSFFTTLIGDNVNKIPRDLSEVGPNDRDFTSSENLMIRVNNPRINNKPASVSNIYPKTNAWNVQYYPGIVEQEIIQIATVRDMEIQAIPFKALVNAGEYGESGILQTYIYENAPLFTGPITGINETPELIGAVPWGKTGADAALYNADSNPFVIKGNQSENKNNPIGAYVTDISVNANPIPPGVLSMVPFLSVAETKPVESLLDIYWETSLSGELSVLNSLVNSQDDGLIDSSFESTDFPESVTQSSVIGLPFNFIKGDGQAANAALVTASIIDVTNGSGTITPIPFSISKNLSSTAFEIKPTSASFFYNQAIVNTPADGVYTISVQTNYNGLTDTIILPNVSLINIAPTIDSFTQPTGITVDAGQTIITLTGKNGSANTSVNTDELVWSLNPAQTPFSINSSTGVITNSTVLINNTSYSIGTQVSDVNGTSAGLSSPIEDVTFTVGNAINDAVPYNICAGNTGNSGGTAWCSQNVEYRFLNTSTSSTGTTGAYPTYFSSLNTPSNPPDNVYNIRARKDTTQTGALTQGTMFITVKIQNLGSSIQDDAYVDYLIQHRAIGTTTWATATNSTTSSAMDGGNGYVRISVGSSDGSTAITTKYTFNVVGEYRLIGTIVKGLGCPVAGSGIVFNAAFGDETFGSGNGSNCYNVII